jgi:thiosulfate/3-mercaptopyruvate sulfurtransferase
MHSHPLIEPLALQALLARGTGHVRVCDCSFDLADPTAGERAFALGHIPGAAYLHLDRDLSTAKTGRNGRHPLPARDAFAARMAALGADDDTLLVACDAQGGMFAARLWWMLRWVGHARVVVLDGGLPAWRAAGGAIEAGPAGPAARTGRFSLRPALVDTIDAATLRVRLGEPALQIVDARAPTASAARTRRWTPWAATSPAPLNRLLPRQPRRDGRFKPPPRCARLGSPCSPGVRRRRWCTSAAPASPPATTCWRWSRRPRPAAKLYPGSWSEWCAQPGSPVATG